MELDQSVIQKLIVVWVVIILGAIIAIPLVLRYFHLRDNGLLKQANTAKILKRYDFYMSNFLTMKRFHNIVKSYIALSCLTTIQVKEKSVKVFQKATLVSLLIPVFLFLTTRDVTITLLGVVASIVYYDTMVDKTIDKMYKALIEDVGDFLGTLQLNYMEYNNIGKSILEADRGLYLDNVVNELFEILSSVNSERKLREFIVKSPLKILCEIAEVCHTTNVYGDSYTDRGESKFIQQLGIIEKEVFQEIRTLKKQTLKFKSLDKIALAGLVIMPIIDIYLLKQIPGTAIIIKGVFGLATKVGVILLTITAYYVISTISRKSIVTQTDFSELVYKLSQHKVFRKYLNNVKPKSKKTLAKVNRKLETALSANSIDTLYTAKILYAVVAFVFAFVLSFIFIATARSYIYHNTQSLSITPILVEERVQEDIDKMDAKFMAMKPEERPSKTSMTETAGTATTSTDPEAINVGSTSVDKTKNELTEFVTSNVRNMNDWDAGIQADRLEKKLSIYNSISFKWYYLLIIYGVGVLGWFLPNIKLKLRSFLVRFEADEDAAQLQTVMITLSATGMSVYEVLYKLLNLATVHQNNISYACQSYIVDPEYTLLTLGESSMIPDFRRMCIKLRKAIYSIPISDAFRNIIVEKEQYLEIKEMYLDDMIRKKSSIANLLAMAPFACVLMFQTLGPLILLGVMQFSEMTQSLTAI